LGATNRTQSQRKPRAKGEKMAGITASDQEAIQVHIVALPLVAWGLARLVKEAGPQFQLSSVSDSATACMAQLGSSGAPLVVLDLDGGEGLDGLANLATVGHAKILVLTTQATEDVTDQVVLAGARGVLGKQEQPETLLKAMERVHRGEIWADRDATGRIFVHLVKLAKHEAVVHPIQPQQARIASLTRRERQTVAALASDASAPGKVLADRLHISENTLRNHLTAIYDKLGVNNRLELYAYAHRNGLGGVQATPGASA
jgi:two-component system nitrate/nitrite response regulator NarL